MRKTLLSLIIGATVLTLAACGGGSSTNDGSGTSGTTGTEGTGNTSTVNAEQVFQANCASCHANNLSGGVGPNLQHIGSQLDEAQILSVIENGKGAMPAGLIKGDEAKAVAAWLAEHK
ncbi:MAG: cytochrome c [Candidatus Carbobacillus altaicus]|uniref:Membrane-attached cytochrome c550 n=1 Tax=Candidatus Carbonibacillus altaicus TaxID=2163959 RepID=A0A2R6Y0F6_9BACL|nr:cytochrome c [Candidatus Carbobacillus altaicus]PTQ56112.1 MAG: Membrane-attached cytochrome c550 [Candidatus Carbobacillus altaicus]